jgi:uncharacterized protein involved in exopolysaccharide biosynthesis
MTQPDIPERAELGARAAEEDAVGLLDLAVPLIRHWMLLTIVPVLAGAIALGITYLIPPTFTATTTFLPPQQQQGSAASALASLGALAGLPGVAGSIRTPGDQYVSLLQSVSVTDKLIDKFKLIEVYELKYRFEARKELSRNVRISLGKKDGLLTVEVDDLDPKRAAEMANQHVEELRRVTSELALTEAQQRRVFFETQLKQTRDRLTAAQQAVEGSGFNAGALRAEPKAAAEGYARLKAELTAAEVRLQGIRRGLSDNTPEVQQQLAMVNALRGQLAKLETVATDDAAANTGYIGKYREFKYQETLFELFSRQFELARLDESREGGLIQVVDAAQVPEWKSKPKRGVISIITVVVSALVLLAAVVLSHLWQRAAVAPATREKVERVRQAMGRRRRA